MSPSSVLAYVCCMYCCHFCVCTVLCWVICRVVAWLWQPVHGKTPPAIPLFGVSGSLLHFQRRSALPSCHLPTPRRLRSLASTSRVRVNAAPLHRGEQTLFGFILIGRVPIFIDVRPAGPETQTYLCPSPSLHLLVTAVSWSDVEF